MWHWHKAIDKKVPSSSVTQMLQVRGNYCWSYKSKDSIESVALICSISSKGVLIGFGGRFYCY